MSNTTANLHRKIDGAADLQGVVRTMKALAASSVGQYEKSVCALADYYRTIELALAGCFRDGDLAALAMERWPPAKSTAGAIRAVVFGSDQGLVGQFNDIVADHAIKTLAALPGKPEIWAVGERVHARLRDAGVAPAGLFSVPNSVTAIVPLVGEILVASDSRHGEFAELHLFYNRPTAGSVYAPGSQRLLPLDERWHRQLVELPWPSGNLPEVMGAGEVCLRALIREYLFISLFRACAESLASENASRLAAMERADRNIDELLENLQAAFHRLRQSDIDEELFDVISGFEALILPAAARPLS
ncbi:MAG: F0F1 ATP synthase subunit gamma [Acetobacteraceae bacterium]